MRVGSVSAGIALWGRIVGLVRRGGLVTGAWIGAMRTRRAVAVVFAARLASVSALGGLVAQIAVGARRRTTGMTAASIAMGIRPAAAVASALPLASVCVRVRTRMLRLDVTSVRSDGSGVTALATARRTPRAAGVACVAAKAFASARGILVVKTARCVRVAGMVPRAAHTALRT